MIALGEAPKHAFWQQLHVTDQRDGGLLLTALEQSEWSNGNLVSLCETRLAEFLGCKNALLVTNATVGLRMALLALDLRPGDEVIVPGMTWPSVPIAVLECGATPVAADVDSETYGISAATFRAVATSRTRAVIPTHLFCSQVDMPALLEEAESRSVYVIEDNAHGFGSRRSGRATGTLGEVGVLSFNQKKILSCGEGGCVVSNNDDLFDHIKAQREVDLDATTPPQRLAASAKISEFQAAVLIGQLEKLPGRLLTIETAAEALRDRLSHHPNVRPLQRLAGTELQSVYNFCFRLTNVSDIIRRRRGLSELLDDLPVAGAYPPLNSVKAIDLKHDARFHDVKARFCSPLPNCETAHFREAIRFPHHVLTLDQDIQNRVAEAIIRVAS